MINVRGPRPEEWSSELSLAWLKRVSEFGVLGIYTHAEVTTVIGRPPDQSACPINVFTLVVLERRADETGTGKPSFLQGPKPIELNSLRKWKFGVARYTVKLEDVFSALNLFTSAPANWSLSGQALRLGTMISVAPQFVPPDGTEPSSLNRLLKNNFWNGSYVLEFFDSAKHHLTPFQKEPARLQELSSRVTEWVPIELAGLADRLGNILIQLPVTALMNNFAKSLTDWEFKVEVEWHPEVKPRSLRAINSMEFDGALCSYGSAPLESQSTILRSHDSSGANRHLIWDDEHQVILAATSPLYYIRAFSISSSTISGDPAQRIFYSISDKKELVPHQVVLRQPPRVDPQAQPDHYSYRGWTHKRIHKNEEARLEKERHFVQYRPDVKGIDWTRQKALNDLRHLINAHAEHGAWLWDPYLSATDLLDTLFHCSMFGAPLRALTQGLVPREARKVGPSDPQLRAYLKWKAERRSAAAASPNAVVKAFVKEQRATLERSAGDCNGLRLEYRIRRGSAGFKFHDRFLIFPHAREEPLVWSLGTSVNSAGKAHHILQRVDNGRLIMDAFDALWNKLNGPHHLIWKHE